MIKTTSFAVPRAPQTSPDSKSRARQHAIKAAKTRAPAVPSMASLFAPPAPVPEISAAQARAIIRETTPKSRANTKAVAAPVAIASTVSRPVPEIETIMPSTSPAPKNIARTTKRKESAPVKLLTPAVVAPQVETDPITVTVPAVEMVVVEVAPKKSTSEPKKSRRPRVPTNFAEQYGQSLSKRVENGIEAPPAEDDSPKKRLNRAERQARRELMNPDDDLLARLQRAHNTIPTVKTEKRPRGWRFDCGRCGQTSFFQTGGAICKCGALAIKD